MKFAQINRAGRFLAAVGLLVGVVLFAEYYWIESTRRAVEELSNQNRIQHQANERSRAEIQGLKASQTKISAMFVRLNDAVFNPRTFPGESGHPDSRLSVRSPDLAGRPTAIQLLSDAGMVVQAERPPNGEASILFEAGSSRLELERLIPLLAEEENSNAFLYLDRVYLSRPAATKPFSSEPTYLDARFSIRLLTAK
jgi:hypothetical protein